MPDHLHALPAGHQLDEYRIDHVLGSGGFGITYYALDIHLNKPVAIKEYLPNDFAVRIDATTVKPKSTSDQDDYQWGLERFLDEARALARFEHPHINKVYRFFQDNNTAYIVLEYIEGETLSAHLKRESRLDAPRLQRLLEELLSGLEEVHAAGYVHRDIKPGNIMLRADGSAVLLDFGAARQAIGTRSKSITSILTPGYAPIEQYDRKAEDVGPWSDLYALGMVAYRCISGIGDSEVPDAVARARLERKGESAKDMKPAAEVGKGGYDAALLTAIDWATKVDEGERPQSVSALRKTLAGGKVSETVAPSSTVAPLPGRVAGAPPKATGSKAWMRLLIILGSLLAVVGSTAVVLVGWAMWEERQERAHWQEVSCGDGESVRRYQQAYPGGRYQSEAETCLADEKKRKAEAARLAAEAEKKRKAEAARLAAEAEKKRKAEAARLAAEVNAKDEKGNTPLHYAVFGDAQDVELLIARGADVNAKGRNGWTPLHNAARKNVRREAAELLIARGADVNAKDEGGETPLHHAAYANAREAADLLIARGADVNAKNKIDSTPLHNAARKNAREVAELLIARGADVNAKDTSDWTPLHNAAFANTREVAELLIARGADVNAKNKIDSTPLHYAARKNAREVAELLIAGGADVNAKNNFGETPRDLAEGEGHSELAQLLR